jgi:hypothetical protein
LSGKFFLSVFLLFAAISFGYTFRDFDWYQHESEHFIYIYHPEIEESVPLVEKIAEESYSLLSRFFGNDLSRKIAIVLWGYEDAPNGLANPFIDSVNSITIGLNYVHREDSCWLRTVISHELSHIFQLTSSGPFGSLIRKYLSSAYLPSALQPMWLSEGFAQFGSYLLRADGYDYRRVSFLKDQLALETPFSEETIVAGYGPIGGEAYYNFGFAFLMYLADQYGEEKLREFSSLKSGILGLAGIEPAFSIVFGRSYRKLKEDFIARGRERLDLDEPVSLYNSPMENSQALQEYSPKSCGGKLYYAIYDRDRGYFSLNGNGVELLSTTMEILDYSVFENEIAIVLLEKQNGSEARLYIFKDGKLTRTKHSGILSLEYLGKERLAVLKNERGVLKVQTLSLRNDRTSDIFVAPDSRVQISTVRATADGTQIAFRVNFEGRKYLALYLFREDELSFYEFESDFEIGSCFSDGFLVSVQRELASDVFLFRSGGTMEGLAGFSRYVRDPVRVRNTVIAAGQLNGLKLLKSDTSVPEASSVPPRGTLKIDEIRPIETRKRYDGLNSWRFVSIIPFDGVSLLFSDPTFNNHLIAGGSLNFETLEPGLHLQLSSSDYLAVDFVGKAKLTGLKPEAYLDIYRQYPLTPKLSFGWKVGLEYPLKLYGSLNVMLEDASALYGGQALLKTSFTVRDTQTATVNVADASINVNLEWTRSNFELSSRIFSRVTLGKNSSVIPVKLWDFESDSSIVVGLSVSSDYILSRRNLNFFNLVHLSKEGIGGRIDMLLGSTLSWRLVLYKIETVFLYAAYPFEVKAGLMLEGARLLPYFDFELLY